MALLVIGKHVISEFIMHMLACVLQQLVDSSYLQLVDPHFFYFRYDALCILLRHSKNVRYWFAHNVLFAYPNRFSEYLLECPSAEVRGAFSKLIVFIAHFSLQDGPCPSPIASPGPSSQVHLFDLGFPYSWEIVESVKFGTQSIGCCTLYIICPFVSEL